MIFSRASAHFLTDAVFGDRRSLGAFLRRSRTGQVAIRNENPALQNDWTLKFHSTDNNQLICYSKESEDRSNLLVTVVNLDPHYTQAGFVILPLDELEIPQDRPFEAEDLLTGERYLWQGPRNYVELNPSTTSGHILKIHRRMRVETDFEYFL